VLDALASITQREPDEVIARVRTVFAQQGWMVQGNVYQAAGDLIIKQESDKKDKRGIDLWIKIVGLIATLLTIIISGITIKKHFLPENAKPAAETKPPAPKIELRGVVRTSDGGPVADATVSLNNETGRSVTTTSDGGFVFDNISGVSGDHLRIFVKKAGYKNHNEYGVLSVPVRIVMEKSR